MRRLVGMFLKPWDLRIGVVTFVAVDVLAERQPKMRASPHLLDISTGLGIAILTVVLAALSILVAFMSEEYAKLLSASKPGVAGAISPYVQTAAASGITTGVSVAGLFLWPIAPPWGRGLLLALALGLTAWAVVGTVELVGITARHGRLRARLPEITEAYRDAKRKAS